ncbi:MAG: ester cyclase [Nitrososphaeraceae archaeon]
MSTEENKNIMQRSVGEIFNKGNYDVVYEIYDENYIGYVPPNDIKGPEEMKQFITQFRNAFPDLKITIEDQIAEGDLVASRQTAAGTHEGDFQGIAATGKKMSITLTVICRFDNSKIVEAWSNMDSLGLLMQLGVIPPPK